MARSLIETLSGDFEPDQYTDNYREALQAVIEAKVEGREVAEPAPAAEETPVIDLMEALRASVAASKGTKKGAKTDPARKPAAAKKRAAAGRK